MDSGADEPIVFSMKLPSLKELSLIKVARILCHTPGIEISLGRQSLGLALLAQNIFKNNSVKELQKKISLLSVPELVKKQIIPLVHHVGRELKEWVSHCYQLFTRFEDDKLSPPWKHEIIEDLLSKDRIRWTAYGTIDTLETARWMVHQQVIPIKTRYELACQWFLEDEIGRLWAGLEPEDKKSMIDNSISFAINQQVKLYWSFKITNETWYPHNLPIDPEEYLITMATYSNYETFEFMINYLWPKLNESQRESVEKEILTNKTSLYSNFSKAQFFLLNKVERQEQVQVLRENPVWFLRKCLIRPFQHLFFPVVSALMEHIDITIFFSLLQNATLEEWDHNKREEIFTALLPLSHKHVFNNDNASYATEMISLQLLNADFEKLELFKGLMIDAPMSSKCDVIASVLRGLLRWQSKLRYLLEKLVIEWFTPETWPTLKGLLMAEMEKEKIINFKDFFQYLDDHFGNTSTEVNEGPSSSKRLKTGV